MRSSLLMNLLGLQGYQWHKDKVQSEDGKKQQAKVVDLLPIAHQLGCTVAQLAIGETLPALDLHHLRATKPQIGLFLERSFFLRDPSEVWVFTVPHQFSLFFLLGPSVVSPQ